MFFEGQKGNRLCEFIGGNSAPCMCVTHDMGVDNPLALAQDRRCRTQEAVQNTAEEDPHRAYCGDTASKGDKERQIRHHE